MRAHYQRLWQPLKGGVELAALTVPGRGQWLSVITQCCFKPDLFDPQMILFA